MPDNLPELRDIHLPDGVSAFPPAYGWWIILLIVLGIVFGYRLFKILRQKSKKLYAKRLLQRIDSEVNLIRAATGISEILRRICVFKYPEAAGLSGQEWIDFLNKHSPVKLTGQDAVLLLNAPYMPATEKSFSQDNIVNLKKFCQSWIGENL